MADSGCLKISSARMQHMDVHRLYMIVPSPGMARGTVRTKVGALILVQFSSWSMELLVWTCLNQQRNWEENMLTGWWFGTCFIFPYVGNNDPNWLIYFQKGWNHQPETHVHLGALKSLYIYIYMYLLFSNLFGMMIHIDIDQYLWGGLKAPTTSIWLVYQTLVVKSWFSNAILVLSAVLCD